MRLFEALDGRRGRLRPTTETDSTMYAKSEITMLNGDMKTVRLDLVVYNRIDDTVLFCVEVYNTHKTVANSRQIAVENGNLLWCEVIAGRVLDVLEDCDDNTTTITIPTEPRMDVERSCTLCIQMDELIRKRKAEEAELARELALKRKTEEAELAREWARLASARPPVKSALAPQKLTKVVFFVGNDKVFGAKRKSGFGPHAKDVHLEGEISAVICRNKNSARRSHPQTVKSVFVSRKRNGRIESLQRWRKRPLRL